MRRVSLAGRAAHGLLALVVTSALCGSARAADTYTIHENLHVGQKALYVVISDYKVKSTSTTNGTPTATDEESGHSWKLMLTVQEVKEGSSVRSLAELIRGSVDTARSGSGNETKTPCPFVGKSIVLTRLVDDSLTNDFHGNASDDDVNLLNDFVTPDQEWYPDHPVAVGDTWDDSVSVAKYASLGPQDRLISKGRLDWVRMIDGKQMAHMTHSMAIVRHEDGNVEEDQEITMTQLVDIASGVIVKLDQTGSSKYTTPITEPTQVTGGTEFTFHAETVPDVPAATTKP
jgi:hypothetical protein